MAASDRPRCTRSVPPLGILPLAGCQVSVGKLALEPDLSLGILLESLSPDIESLSALIGCQEGLAEFQVRLWFVCIQIALQGLVIKLRGLCELALP
jgi:hypothetical protein